MNDEQPWKGLRERFSAGARSHPNLRVGLSNTCSAADVLKAFTPVNFQARKPSTDATIWIRWYYDERFQNAHRLAEYTPWERHPLSELNLSGQVRQPLGQEELNTAVRTFQAIAVDAAYAVVTSDSPKVKPVQQATWDLTGELGWILTLFHFAQSRPEGTVLRVLHAPKAQMLPQDPFTASNLLIDWLSDSAERPPASSGAAATEAGPGWLAPADIAKKYGLKKENLRKRLDRFRHNHADGWMEVPKSERTQRGPKFLYREDAINQLISAMRSS